MGASTWLQTSNRRARGYYSTDRQIQPCSYGVRTTTVPSFCAGDHEVELEQAQVALVRRILLPYLEGMEMVGGSSYITFDIGAAFGWYSMFMATMGFRVLSFEPGDVETIVKTAAANALTERIRII